MVSIEGCHLSLAPFPVKALRLLLEWQERAVLLKIAGQYQASPEVTLTFSVCKPDVRIPTQDGMKTRGLSSLLDTIKSTLKSVRASAGDTLKCPPPPHLAEVAWVPCSLPPEQQDLESLSPHSLQGGCCCCWPLFLHRVWAYDPQEILPDYHAKNSHNPQSSLFAISSGYYTPHLISSGHEVGGD